MVRCGSASTSAGELTGVLLPAVAEFNRPALHGDVLGEIDALPALYARIGFDARLREGIAERMIRAAMANPFRHNNVRPAGPEDLGALLAGAAAQLSRPRGTRRPCR